ncbi:MAG: Hpt domain-containing protein [Thaumarchaeota archaeon]|nr:Hpt domain-containing protein [Nitrososphaerota archaeon]
MSDKFLDAARQEIQLELDELERIVLQCSNDEDILENSKNIERHLHKIKGLAPMMGQEKVGELAKTSDSILNYMINKGLLPGSHPVITKTINDMKQIFNGSDIYDVSDFKKQIRNKFPHIPDP